MKHHTGPSTLLGLGIAGIGMTVASASGQVVFDQIGSDAGAQLLAALIPASQDFEAAFDTYDIVAIDDFTLAEETTLATFDVVLGGFNGYTGYEGAAGFSVRFYADETNAGLDLDDTVLQQDFAAPSVVVASDISPTPPDDLLRFTLASGSTLGAGTWWVGFFPNNEFGTNGQTGIIDSSIGDNAAFQANPAGGFGFPPDGLQAVTANLAYRIAQAGCFAVECPGDLDLDGMVGTTDLLQLLAAWGMNDQSASCLAAPEDTTDTADLLVLLAAWGECPKVEPDNDLCDEATELVGTGTIVDSLDGATNDFVGDCDGVVNDGPGRWYFFVADADNDVAQTYVLTTCSAGTTVDTRINVYCGECDALNDQACNDDFLPCVAEGGSEVRLCAADGITYYVLVHAPEGETGTYELTITKAGGCSDFDETCLPIPTGDSCFIEDPAGCQLPNQSFNGPDNVSGATSDLEAGFRVADNMTVEGSGVISNVCFWGSYFAFPGDCSPPTSPDDFTITFYTDSSGLPGSVLATYAIGDDANGIWTGEMITSFSGSMRREYEYSAELDPPLSVTPGTCIWMEVVNNTFTDGCFWLWSTSPDGDVISAQDTDDFPYEPGDNGNYDLAWCIDTDVSVAGCQAITGACCIEDGSCIDDVDEAACDAAGGIFFPSQSCMDCPEFATYQYDDFVTETAIGSPGGDLAWIHRFDAEGGADTIDEILTVIGTAAIPGGSGINPGETLGWAILNDDLDDSDPATATLLASGTVAIEAGAIETDVPQVVSTGGVAVSGSFFVVCWVTYPPTFFPAPVDSDTSDPTGLDAWFVGVDAGTFDPADLSGAALLSGIVDGVWLLRAN